MPSDDKIENIDYATDILVKISEGLDDGAVDRDTNVTPYVNGNSEVKLPEENVTLVVTIDQDADATTMAIIDDTNDTNEFEHTFFHGHTDDWTNEETELWNKLQGVRGNLD